MYVLKLNRNDHTYGLIISTWQYKSDAGGMWVQVKRKKAPHSQSTREEMLLKALTAREVLCVWRLLGLSTLCGGFPWTRARVAVPQDSSRSLVHYFVNTRLKPCTLVCCMCLHQGVVSREWERASPYYPCKTRFTWIRIVRRRLWLGSRAGYKRYVGLLKP